MPVIAFLSPKGGAGKSTSALILATQLARATKVRVLEPDANRPLTSWFKGGNCPENLTIDSDVDEETILDKIDDAASKAPFVIVDLEGTAAKIALLAVSQADLVLIPTQGSHLDAEQANRSLQVIRQQERISGRHVDFAVLLTRTNSAVRTRSLTHIHRDLLKKGIPVFKSEINQRTAFEAMFSFKQTLEGLPEKEVANVDNAIANAEEFTKEVIETLRAAKARDASVAARSEAA